jgi:CheY-like chemotaxis protein
MTERLVLCVDDEAIILLALKQKLRSSLGAGWRCETALDGESALEYLAEFKASGIDVAAVISDWRMPGMGGDEFLRLVRARWPDIVLVLLSGYADRTMVQALAAEIGLAATLQKPCDATALARLIRKG